jgi:histidyl-tRNA synthetase
MAGFETLLGFRAFYPEACERRNYLFKLWRSAVRCFGFREFDPPILEPLDLFTEKSGPEIVGQLFNFTDKGGREVALRPEITPSLARMVGVHANSLPKPVKWFAIGENFRYERPQKDRLRSHYQLNVDILGEPSVEADAELISVLLHCLTICGLEKADFALRLSDRKLWSLWLTHELGEKGDVAEVLGVVDKLEREKEEVSLAKLEKIVGSASSKELWAHIQDFCAVTTVGELQSFFQRLEVPEADFMESFDRLKTLLRLLDERNLGHFVRLDFGIVRGLAYYTGTVFEVFALDDAGNFTGRAVAGGGRYDHLLAKLGYPDTPAVGFGMGDVVLTSLLSDKNRLPPLVHKPDVFIVSTGETAGAAAKADAMALRASGLIVEYPLKSLSFNKQFKLAGQSGALHCLIYEEGPVAENQIRVRDLNTREEQTLARGQIRDFLLSLR